MSRISEFVETGSTLVVARAGGMRELGDNGQVLVMGLPSWEDKDALKLTEVKVAQL